jgi:methyl-accepting chemotaxis protein
VSHALKGESKSGILFDEKAQVPFSRRAGAPIYHQGEIVGTVVLILNLGSEALVDSLKATTGMEVTLFRDNIRFMTSIKGPDGNRIIGTKLNNSAIEEKVLIKGETAIGKANIQGRPYNTAYWPMRDADNNIVGMWFIGNSAVQQNAAQNRAIVMIAVCSLGIAIFLAFVATLVGKRIALPLKHATDYAVLVADGNLDAPMTNVKSNDEVGLLANALSRMVGTLKERIAEAENVSNQAREQAKNAETAKLAAEAAGEEARKKQENMLAAAHRLEDAVKIIKNASADLTERIRMAEDGAVKQAEHVTASAGAITEMSSSAQEVAGNAAHAKDFSDQTRGKASAGAGIVEEVVNDIRTVQKNSIALKQDMTVLDEHAKSINQVMGVISDIADQTNLLALNAAIEAARAGDAGRGFAVVADEVRKLAEKTMASTDDVSQAVSAIRKSMDKSMTQVDTTVSNIEQTTRTAVKSGEALREIVNMAGDTARQMEGIVTACDQQSIVSEEVSNGISNVNVLASRTVEIMKEAAHDVASLASQTDSLGVLVDEMKRG